MAANFCPATLTFRAISSIPYKHRSKMPEESGRFLLLTASLLLSSQRIFGICLGAGKGGNMSKRKAVEYTFKFLSIMELKPDWTFAEHYFEIIKSHKARQAWWEQRQLKLE